MITVNDPNLVKERIMSKTYGACAIGGFVVGYLGMSYYLKRKEEKKMAQVRATVSNLIKDVPGYNKPSR
jgi:type VI protein secretion system component VasF